MSATDTSRPSIEDARVTLEARREAEKATAETAAQAAAGYLADHHGLDVDFTGALLERLADAAHAALHAYWDRLRCPGCDADLADIWMVSAALWASAGLQPKDGHWCRSCFARLIDRPLVEADLTDAPCNASLLAEMRDLSEEEAAVLYREMRAAAVHRNAMLQLVKEARP